MKKGLCYVVLFLCFSTSLLSQEIIPKLDKLLNKEKCAEAKKELVSMYAKDSNNVDYYYYMGEINRHLGNYDAALTYLDKILKANSNSALALASKGVNYALKNDTLQAIALITKAISIDSKTARFYNDRAAVYMMMDHYDKALPDLKQANTLDPNNYRILYNIGSTYIFLGQYGLAVYSLTQSIDLHKDRLSYYQRGYANELVKDYKSALKDLNLALKQTDSEDPHESVDAGTIYYERAKVYKAMGDEDKYKKNLDLAKQNGYKADDDDDDDGQ